MELNADLSGLEGVFYIQSGLDQIEFKIRF